MLKMEVDDLEDEFEGDNMVTWDCQSPLNVLKRRGRKFGRDDSPVSPHSVNVTNTGSRLTMNPPEVLRQFRRGLLAIEAEVNQKNQDINDNNNESVVTAKNNNNKHNIDEIFGEDDSFDQQLSQLKDPGPEIATSSSTAMATKPELEPAQMFPMTQKQPMKLRERPPAIGGSSKCSPEEIERKRLEAKAKLMAKKWEHNKQEALLRLKKFKGSSNGPSQTVTSVTPMSRIRP